MTIVNMMVDTKRINRLLTDCPGLYGSTVTNSHVVMAKSMQILLSPSVAYFGPEGKVGAHFVQ